MTPEALVRRADAIGLDGVAVTDHNTMQAVESARQAAAGDLLVIPGEEIDTPDGQIIGIFLSEPIEPWQSARATIDQIHDQGGFAIAPHPFDSLREGLTTVTDYVNDLDAIETINSRCIRSQYNETAQAFAAKHGLPEVGGSDAHFSREVGTAHTEVHIDHTGRTETPTLSMVEDAVRNGRVTPAGETGSLLSHVGTKCVKIYNRIRQR